MVEASEFANRRVYVGDYMSNDDPMYEFVKNRITASGFVWISVHGAEKVAERIASGLSEREAIRQVVFLEA